MKMSRKERETEHHYREILEAAEEAFAEKGYVTVSMEEVASRAEFAVGTLYKFFRSKDELFREILRRKLETFIPRIDNILSGRAKPLEKIKAYFFECLEHFWESPRFFRLFTHQTMGAICDHRAGFAPGILELYHRILKSLEGVFKKGIASGVFRPVSPMVHVLTLEGIRHYYLMHLTQMESPVRNKDEEQALWEFFTRGALTSHPQKGARLSKGAYRK
jgi:AcrR family transcriptional regulator